jgi:RNA polymerase sigma-70 factor (ECF subfamily)
MSLITRILTGDKQAILELYKTYAPRLERYLLQKLPAKEDVEEIVNDTFLEAIDSLQLLKKEENLQAWLYRIAHNKTVDFYRKRKIKQVLLSQAPFLEILAKEMHQPEFQFEKNRIRDKIEKALHEISAPYREILQLHYEENIPVKQIALEMNLSFKATESLLYRARKSFQKAYEKEE